jgi:hypothetical protein
MTVPKIPRRELRELESDDDEIPEAAVQALFERGSVAREIMPRLFLLVRIYIEDDAEKAKISGFLSWVPGETLEKFLAMALEYAAKKTLPKMGRGRNGRGR